MFTFTKIENPKSPDEQTRVCRIKGGFNNDKIIYLNQKDNCEKVEMNYSNPIDYFDEDFYKVGNYKLMSTKDRENLRNKMIYELNEESDDDNESYESDNSEDMKMQPYIEKLKPIIQAKCKYNIELYDGGKTLICPSTLPERVYISGQNGSGKSYLSGIYSKEYNKLFPKNKIIIFSVHEKDEAYDDVKKLVRVNLKDEELIKSPLEVPKFKNSLIIFDDCDRIQDKKIKAFIDSFEIDILTNGRKYGIYVLTLSHMLMDWKNTRNKINECSRIIMFGQSGSKYHITRFLKIHGGLEPQQIKKIFSLPSRWFCISMNYPNYILYDTGVYLLKNNV